jgi:hypothetical protein
MPSITCFNVYKNSPNKKKTFFFLLSSSNDPSLWCRVDMSRKYIESCYLRDVLLRGTIVLKMFQTTVCLFIFSSIKI